MNKQTDKKHFSLDANAPLTAQQQSEIAALNALPDESIDFSDIAPLSEKFWQTCRKVYKHRFVVDNINLPNKEESHNRG